MLMPATLRFRLGSLRLTGESKITSLISPVSHRCHVSAFHGDREQHEG
jgi:hypothetical protein